MDKNVFVIDGDEAIRDGLLTLGELLGVDVHCYATAEEFLSTTVSTNCLPAEEACIICAQELDGINGLTLFRRLKSAHHRMPFALVTSSRSLLVNNRAKREGVDQIVKKPLADRALIEFIENATHSHA